MSFATLRKSPTRVNAAVRGALIRNLSSRATRQVFARPVTEAKRVKTHKTNARLGSIPSTQRDFARAASSSSSASSGPSKPAAISSAPLGMYKKLARIPEGNKIFLIGFGSIGKGVLPLLFRHFEVKPEQLHIIAAAVDEVGAREAKEFGVEVHIHPLTVDNYKAYLDKTLKSGDFCLNLSVDVSSYALMDYCKSHGVLYLDTCVEPWAGGHHDYSTSLAFRSNYALRERARTLRTPGAPTAVICHGANPGMVSHMVKQALLNIAADTGVRLSQTPKTKAEWAALAQQLSIKTIHIAERDTQVGTKPKEVGEFVNTWSIDGFVSEGCHQPSELGWGTHEKHFPHDGKRHKDGCKAAIYLTRPGASVNVRTWTPNAGPIRGFLVTHNESISIADYFSVKKGEEVQYRPTVHYAYHPCDSAIMSIHETAGKNYQDPTRQRLMVDEIKTGMDELGVLLMGHKKGAYWFGSQLSIEQTRGLVGYNNATSLQVGAGVLAGMTYALKNPRQGVVDPDEIPFEPMMEVMLPYLGNVVGHYTDWNPLQGRLGAAKVGFVEDIDREDPWQFKNFRVV